LLNTIFALEAHWNVWRNGVHTYS